MTFWGVEVKPNEPYTLDFHGVICMLTQATLGVSSSSKKSTLQVQVGDKEPIFLCTLLPEKAESFLLNLEFDEDEDVIFSVVGPTSIHLSGILQMQPEDDDEEDYSDGDFGGDFGGEDIAGTDSEDNEFGSEDDSDDSMDAFDDEDNPMIPPPGARKSGVVIEEIEEEPASEKGGNKQAKKKELPSNGKPLLLKGKTDDVKLESEDEDGLPASASVADKGKTKKNKKDTKDDGKSTSNLKRKVDAIEQDKEPKSDEGSKKKNKKNKNKAKIEKEETEAKTSKNAVDEAASAKQGKEEKKTPAKTSKNAVDEAASAKLGKEEKKTPKSVKETKQQHKEKPAKTKTFPSGLVIEDLEIGKPNGKKATSGKKVSVRYIGQLKKNNKVFDSNLSGKPFKFKLGAGQVIKGWDVGVVGMQVGGKRRLTIPPSMGYGASGAAPQIPPNAWLSFDVTLMDVA